MNQQALQAAIEAAWEDRDNVTPQSTKVAEAVEACIQLLDSGAARVAEPEASGQWQVNQWLKKAVLLSFRLHGNAPVEMGALRGWDKVPLKYADWSEADFQAQGARVVPPAAVRRGSYIAPGAVLMPSYVNIGAWVGKGTMVDTWATVGSCAQIGENVHLSGGAGIGGVLEPLQANPTIIEDNVFIGARSEIVEGVIVERDSVISMGVFIGQSTPIYDRETGETLRGRVPAGSVVVAGSLPRDNGAYSINCAVIVKKVDAGTRAKVGLNALLRDV
ncbi:2,3,4,5-tetrahydropyridine-2,6-dicarboxylate N-succinyltransferase [Algiphilus sp. NNCM1]|uniref:2,3,4,5-tetrahydropyridine-2,6-dicarboxylate N-succinyltransferase n=1 Tax=Algiphilus sp. TaxID=1872431 RepID=UPI001CA7953A|nr:2,3,4,5-tetrahydropyridine-2,6-dicarboxylate N-succinyltransferase [Algiphilus sp.]MBY8965069.1 2,3,4,5-tetrahydropyridine-2,6-dicarboxylate N-succinyltransferase [Algiphilus acroporae]MCI5063458.1 2,3,4,5-tetrahydropyridine-2,6-dicarboxylate N-succinyltransferase [Algiphilus sp.]MCI5104222.1 2,3,4,5-tetrahydropyridine-2,6-dicarboxylate N-succinyltransferase [Algiphilus sp.]